MTRSLLAFTLLGALAACGPSGGGGDDDGPGPDAAGGLPGVLTDGGGVAGPAVDGVLNVYAVEEGGSVPIVGASVRVGAADAAAPLTATTDANGLATFIDASLAGAQTITVTAPGHTAVTWIGVAGANATVPLPPQPRPVPTAHASGTIAGWTSLPAPSYGHYTLGVVLYTLTDDVAAAENHLVQPTAGDGTPLDFCVRTSASDPCSWQLLTRTGQQRHFAVIVDGDSQLSSDPADDTYTLIGYAVGPSATLTASQQVTGESLTIVGGSLSNLSVSFPGAPGGLGKVAAIPMLDLGADGRIVFPLPTVEPGHTTTQVIPPSGQFAGTYDLVALATPASASVPYSTSFVNAISLGGTSTFPAWLPTPTGLTANGHAFTFGAPAGANVHYASYTRADGTVVWSVTILDGSTAFALPALAADPLGGASLTYQVTSTEVTGFDPSTFSVAGLAATLHRAAAASLVFTP